MSRRLGSRDVLWLALVVGAVALLLVNVVFGVRGFDRPRAAPVWRVLEAPGTVLGWGGVALIALAIPYAVLTWLRGKGPGRVVSVLGALVVAFGIGGLAGALAHPAAAGGGRIAGTIAEFLRDAMGPMLAGVLFGLVCVPGLVLALVPLLAHATTGTGPRPVEGEDDDPARGWYPERRLGPDGEEIPMAFEGTDVGEIRLREPEPEPPVEEGPPAIASLPASSERRSRPILGIRFADETEPDSAAGTRPEALPVPDESRLPQGVRFAPSKDAPAEPEPEPEPEAPAVEPPVTEPPPPAEPIVAPEDVAAVEPAAAEPAPPPAAPPTTDAPRRKGAPAAPERATPPAPPPVAAKPPRAKGKPPKAGEATPSLFGDLTPEDEEAPPPLPAPTPPAPTPPAETPRAPARKEPVAKEPVAKEPVPKEMVRKGPTAKEPGAKRARSPSEPAPAAPPAPAQAHAAADDPLFVASVEAALERGSASLVLLKRKLGVGYARAESLMEALVAGGILGEMTASGSRPTLITREDWERRRR